MTDDLELLRYPIGRFQKPAQYDPAMRAEWIAMFEALPQWLDVVIENLDEAQLNTPYRPGGWTVVQVIHHIADSHMNGYIRTKLALTEDKPTVKPYDENLWAELPDVAAVPINVSITLLHALHRRWVGTLKAMQPADWERSYFHPQYGHHVPLWEMLALYAWHGRHHMEQVRSLRSRMDW